MRKDFKYSINQGLPGGANELKKFVKGSISVTGYKSDSPDVNNDFNIIPSNRITMQGVNFPVLGVDDLGYEQMMMPGGEYNFPGNYVTEIPQMGKGGLTQWFDEKWTDVKTGKPCGRSGKEKGSRPYPACRPSKRVNETTPKTTSELSSAEKAKFKREKTSGKRISYNHKRKELGGEAGWLEQYQVGGEFDPEFMFKNKYNTELTPSETADFSKWAAKESQRQGRDILNDIGAYDVKGFWKSGDYKNMDSDNHGTDTWKKPNHPTFSNQSRYHGADGWYGGNWTDKAGYQPSKQTLETYGPDYYDWMFKSEPGRSEYLDMSRYESGLNKPTPFVYQKGGRTPIYVSDPDDPRLKAYNDSTDAYDFGVRSVKEYNAAIKKGKEKGTPLKNIPKKHNQGLAPWIGTNIMPIETNHASPTGTKYGSENSDFTLWTFYTKFKKPVQPVQYKPAQKQVSYPNQPIGRGMTRSISKNTNSIQKSNPTPIYVNDPNDPRLKSYNDSLSLYNKEKRLYEDETKLSYDNLLKYPASNPSGPRYGYTYSNKPLHGYKKPVQSVKYRDPEIVAKQQQLIDAGYNIGTADGIWGKKSQQAWDQMSTPKQSEVNMSFETPVMKVKGMTEENADALKKQYKDEFGANFKSQDNVFNNLQKSLGRRPTVTEYNKAIQQYNSSINSMRNGGWLEQYQFAGEVSTEQNPDPIGQVHVRAKDKGWFDNYIERPLRKWGRSYAKRISNATGGSEWYKQPNSVASAFFSTGPGFALEAPQLSATYAATGKVQTPSEAMDIQNPYGAFAVDAVLDPTNLLGAGLLKQPLKNLGRNIVNSPNNIGNAKLYDELVNIDGFLGEGIGELIAGRKNRKALSEGNTWLKNWIADPITQNKIENDLAWASQRNDQYGLGYQQAKSFVPNVREYPLSEQMKDLFIRKEGNIHADNSGVSYLHNESPITRQRRLLDEQSGIAPGINMRYYGSWASRGPYIGQSVRKSNVIHEGTHDWTTNFLLNNSGQADAIKNIYSDKIKNISEEWQNLRNQGISPSQVMGKQNADLGYLADPTEVHARIMELRQLMKMTPEQSVMVTPEKAQDIIRTIENPKNAKFIDPKFLDVIDKDPKKLSTLFNRLWAAPAATALGASQLQDKKYGGWLNKYQYAGETSTAENPVRMNPIHISAKRRNQDYRTYQDNTVNNNQIVPSEFRGRRYVQPTLSEYVEPSIGNRILNTLASPMTALSNNRTGSRNPFDYALDMVNPFSWIQSGERAVGSLSEGQYRDAALNALGALPALGFADDAGRALSKAGNYATTQTPLKNAWMLNPRAYQYNLPENTMWRGLGQEGMEDAVSSGLFRSKQNVPDQFYPGSSLRVSKSFGTNPYFTPKFKTAATYGDNYLAEVPRDAANWTQRYKRSDWSQFADRPIPISEGRILQKDWLQGYRPLANIRIPDIAPSVSPTPASWQMQELPGLHLKSTMSDGAIGKIVESKTGLINVEQALGIIGKESGGADKVALIKQRFGDNIPKKMDYNEFRKVVQDQLIPLERQFSEHASNYGIGKLDYPSPKRSSYETAITHANVEKEKQLQIIKEYEGYLKNPNKYKKAFSYDSNLSKTNDELLPQIKSTLDDYKQRLVDTERQISKSMEEMKLLPLENQTLILGNKGKFGRGSSAHGNPEETLGHAHFLRDAETPDVLTVTQIQSDAFQGTHRSSMKTKDQAQFSYDRQLEHYTKNKERLEGITKVDDNTYQFADGQKMSKSTYENMFSGNKEALDLSKAELENFTQKQLLDKNHQERYLQELVDYAGKRGDVNKVRVPTSETAAKVQGYSKNTASGMDDMGLPTDLGYSPEHQTILKKYSEQPKTIKKLFGVEPQIVTDGKGNTWYEFDIPKKFKEGKGEIKAFSTIGGIGTAGLGASQLQEKKYGGWLDSYQDGGQTKWLNNYK